MGAFLKLHWFWKLLIISGATTVAYALVKRDCPPCDPGLQLNPHMRTAHRMAGGLHRSGLLRRRRTANVIRRGGYQVPPNSPQRMAPVSRSPMPWPGA